MFDSTVAERERIVDGLLSFCQYDPKLLTATVADITFGTIQYILDDETTLDELESSEKAIFGVKFEKRFIKRLGLPRKISKKINPYGLKLDTRVSGIDLDVKTTLGGSTWMIPGEARGHWLFVVSVDPKTTTFSYGLIKATDENLRPGKNQDKKGSISAEGKSRAYWFAENVSYLTKSLRD